MMNHRHEGIRLGALLAEMRPWLPDGTQSITIDSDDCTYTIMMEETSATIKITEKIPWKNFVRCEEKLAKGFPLSYSNPHFVVHCKPISSSDGEPIALWLSIRNSENTAAAHDWRTLQRIKNEIAGTSIDAMEIYPDESKLVDSCNQFHLWCLPPGMSIPMGYQKRDVLTPEQALEEFGEKVQQRPFEKHHSAEGLEAIGPAWAELWYDFKEEK